MSKQFQKVLKIKIKLLNTYKWHLRNIHNNRKLKIKNKRILKKLQNLEYHHEKMFQIQRQKRNKRKKMKPKKRQKLKLKRRPNKRLR